MIKVSINKSSRWLLPILGIFFYGTICAQQSLRIEDPTRILNLSYPEGWKYKDDGYNLILYPKGQKNNIQLDITYFSYDEKVPADSLFWIQAELVFPTQYKVFNRLNQGSFETEYGFVRFLEFSAKKSWRIWNYTYYQFIQLGSEFRVFLRHRRKLDEDTKKRVLEILQSIQLSNKDYTHYYISTLVNC
ncbi:hypothetical protein [Luteibaculum oceani]|uniref:Uncharacterized protein n=1 Tax=Luteibaculum oceani TaxID=1294296 RepID=A0A5C6USB5_9FLAO|nr:hypothetical protein [Luteibaculum oceani]TXC76127.1 hypothetical protein FRX97_11485 [Luteibaculum oceani]